MSSKFLHHESTDGTATELQEGSSASTVETDPSQSSDLDDSHDSEDINAIAETHQRKFPVVVLLITCAVIIGLLAGVVYYVKKEMGTIGEKQKAPTTSPDPLLTTKPLEINELPPHFASAEAPSVAAAAPAPGGAVTATPSAQGTSTCPHVQVKDPLGNPVLDPNGVPAMMDCQGRVVRAPEIVPAPQASTASPGGSVTPQKSSSSTQQSAAATPAIDRYRGAVVLGKDEGMKPSSEPRLPSLPSVASAADAAITALQQQLAFSGLPNQATPVSPPITTPGIAQATGPAPNPARSGTQGRNFAVKSIDENLVIPKGHTADCALTMRAVTETNGFAECIITANVYSANGRTLLIERFSKALGEYNVNSAAGQRVIPILWTSIRKPGGITIELSAPAVDGLGGAGLPATVDNRWGERIGGAYLLSIVKDVIAYKTAKDASGAAAGQVYQNTTQASNDIVEKILSTTIGIRPTLYANQGDRALILFNRDVDFSGVYDVQRRK